jgi:hypothetical protein
VQITASVVSLKAADVPASAAFLTSHFGFRQEMAADGPLAALAASQDTDVRQERVAPSRTTHGGTL